MVKIFEFILKLFKPSTPYYYPSTKTNKRTSNMRKITRPNSEDKVSLIEETYGKPEEEKTTKDMIPFSIDSPRRDPHVGPYRFCLMSKNGRFTNNGYVMYFRSKNQAKRMRNGVNHKLRGDIYWVEELSEEEILRNAAAM